MLTAYRRPFCRLFVESSAFRQQNTFLHPIYDKKMIGISNSQRFDPSRKRSKFVNLFGQFLLFSQNFLYLFFKAKINPVCHTNRIN